MSVNVSSRARSGESLRERRARRRRRIFSAFFFFVLLLCGAVVYGLWRPEVRITQITVIGKDSSVALLARQALSGTYGGIVPRNSIFFPPIAEIRAAIKAANPSIAAVSVSRAWFSGLTIMMVPRAPVARWCGVSAPGAPGADCYLFDTGGFLYATATEPLAAVVSTGNPDGVATPFVLFDAYTGAAPVGATLQHASDLPAVFEFARQVGTLGPSVATIAMRDGEVDFFLASSTPGAQGARITYLLGSEETAFSALSSAQSALDLSDPSLEYVDLRFRGKLYVKRAAHK